MSNFVDVVDVLLTFFFTKGQQKKVSKIKGWEVFVDVVDVVFYLRYRENTKKAIYKIKNNFFKERQQRILTLKTLEPQGFCLLTFSKSRMATKTLEPIYSRYKKLIKQKRR